MKYKERIPFILILSTLIFFFFFLKKEKKLSILILYRIFVNKMEINLAIEKNKKMKYLIILNIKIIFK